MKNTIFFLLFFCTLFIYCNANKKLILKKINTETTPNNTNFFSEIVGEWNISVTSHKGLDSTCNVCPRINFNVNGTGKITKSKIEEVFKWKVNNNVLNIVYDVNVQNKTFTDYDYVINFVKKNNYIELKLVDEKKENFFILRKIK